MKTQIRKTELSALTAMLTSTMSGLFKHNTFNPPKFDISFFPQMCQNIIDNANPCGYKTGARGVSQLPSKHIFSKKARIAKTIADAKSLKKMCEKEYKQIFA